ncbi:MAG: tetratricopeptide repeat protein, partial [Saprospiraceae bacterium]|nr:tetratricopeptide repeat protein [Saprospiraceae bacterium]
FDAASKNLEWLLENTPDLNSSLYINGVKIYKELEKAATGDKKKEYQQRVMDLYDLRIEYFNSEGDVMNRKAYDAYKFYKDDKTKYEMLYGFFEKTYELNGNDVGSQNLVAYMDVIRRYKLTGGDLSDDQILEKYDQVTQIIDYKTANGEDAAKMAKTKDFVDRMLTSMVTIDCEFVIGSLGPRLKEDPEDLGMAKKIMSLSLTAGCTDDPIFLDASMVVQEKEPTYGVAKVIGKKMAADKDYDGAEKYYGQALELADDNMKKADIYYEMGVMYSQRGMKASARTNFYKCVEADPARTKSFKLIGDLYMTSYDECKRDESKVEDRAVFIAAYNMYRKAGDERSMANAQAQFPSIEDIFTENYSEGDTFKVGCWINETVTLQKRPES